MMLAALWHITLELAPWLLLGAAIAGLLHGLLPGGFVRRHLRGHLGVVRAVALGVPLPLCSCGVIPAGLGLRKDGAGPGATVGFLISTPQTGVDSVLVSASFLGAPFAVFKVVAAAVTGLVGGWIAQRLAPQEEQAPACGSGASSPDEGGAPPRRDLRAMLDHALDILRSIWKWLLFGVVVSAAIDVFVPDTFFSGLADGGRLIPLLAALLVSLPLYVCATASVPIAAALVASGMPAGAALVFLMAGPATNVATIGAVYRALGGTALATYLGTIIGGSLLAGLFFDSFLGIESVSAQHLHGAAAWWSVASALLLLALVAWFAAEDLRRWLHRRAATAAGHGRMAGVGNLIDVPVAGMTCQNCVARLERALQATEGVSEVAVRLQPGRAIVRGAVDMATVSRVVDEAGYRVVVDGVSAPPAR